MSQIAPTLVRHWRSASSLVALCVVATGVTVAACSGGEGPPGAAGLQGGPGPQGSIGPPGNSLDGGVPDAALPTGCTSPCHGFGNVVDQWQFSKHYIMKAEAVDEPAWTSAGACGNCHAIDGLERRVAGEVGVADGGVVPVDVDKGHMSYQAGGAGPALELGYTGPGRVAIVYCTTCHAFTPTNDPHNTGSYVPGSAPLRVASGADDFSMIEKSPEGSTTTVGQAAGKWKTGNTCVMCHKSRKDVTFYITPTDNKINSSHWGPHEGPQADVYSGLGGYHFAGATYGTSVHTTVGNGCTSCHMQPVKSNKDVPDHSMRPALAFCKSCHTTFAGTNFDVQGGQSLVRAALKELEAALNAKNLLTRGAAKPYPSLSPLELSDGNFHLDGTRPGSLPDGTDQLLDAATAGAVYNYLLIARSKDFGVHNPTYCKQLLFDSIKQIKGTAPTSLPVRPS
ncbi:MAG: hypothetical protein ABI175_03890 [Polyangiales bacterium]